MGGRPPAPRVEYIPAPPPPVTVSTPTQSLQTQIELSRVSGEQNRLQNRRDLNFISQSMPIVDTYAETAIQRALMADKASPTKISQQRLRAQTGEAALMQAIANQASAAAQIGNIGTSRRYGR